MCYLDEICCRRPPLLKVLLPVLLLHLEGKARAQDTLGTGGDGVRGGGFCPFLPSFCHVAGWGSGPPLPVPALLTAGSAKKEMPSRAKPAASIRPSHVCGVLSP